MRFCLLGFRGLSAIRFLGGVLDYVEPLGDLRVGFYRMGVLQTLLGQVVAGAVGGREPFAGRRSGLGYPSGFHAGRLCSRLRGCSVSGCIASRCFWRLSCRGLGFGSLGGCLMVLDIGCLLRLAHGETAINRDHGMTVAQLVGANHGDSLAGEGLAFGVEDVGRQRCGRCGLLHVGRRCTCFSCWRCRLRVIRCTGALNRRIQVAAALQLLGDGIAHVRRIGVVALLLQFLVGAVRHRLLAAQDGVTLLDVVRGHVHLAGLHQLLGLVVIGLRLLLALGLRDLFLFLLLLQRCIGLFLGLVGGGLLLFLLGLLGFGLLLGLNVQRVSVRCGLFVGEHRGVRVQATGNDGGCQRAARDRGGAGLNRRDLCTRRTRRSRWRSRRCSRWRIGLVRVGQSRRILAQVLAAARDVGARAHDGAGQTAFNGLAHHAIHQRLAIGIVLPELFLRRLRHFLQYAFGGHAARHAFRQANAALARRGLAAGHAGFQRLQAHLVGNATGQHGNRCVTHARTYGALRGLRRIVLVGLVHGLAGLHRAFAGTSRDFGRHLLAQLALQQSGDFRPHGAGLECAGTQCRAASAHQALGDHAARDHRRQGLHHLVDGVEGVRGVGLGQRRRRGDHLLGDVHHRAVGVFFDGAYILPGVLYVLLVAGAARRHILCRRGFLGPLARLEAGSVADHIGHLAEGAVARGERGRDVQKARDHAGQFFHAGFEAAPHIAHARVVVGLLGRLDAERIGHFLAVAVLVEGAVQGVHHLVVVQVVQERVLLLDVCNSGHECFPFTGSRWLF